MNDLVAGNNLKLLLVLIATMVTCICACHSIPSENSKPYDLIESQWGIEVIGIRESAAGYMLDFRYRVVDPDKSAPLFNRRIRPYLIDEETGARLEVPNPPKVGPLRTSDKPKANRTYFILFGNPGKFIKKGARVTIVIGDLKIKDLVVQ